ncbi:MAG: LLM class flavin-dependent oxidoreductase [Candidatus Rokubacteria bacterium]|nr:LLM class flavin-dependent oxidoreductase [Candidatus Rokubacteria bacterium]
MRIKFGTFHLMERPFWKSEPQVILEHLEQMRLVDELGFDAVWLTEHHFSSVPYVPDVPGEYGISTSPFALACAVSQITRRVRIGTAVKVLALEHPLRTAEDAALADVLSLGRLDFGVGLGYRKYEFEGFGVPIAEKVERFKEALEIVVGAWTNEEFSYAGRFHQIPRLSLMPKPYQRPHPPVWIASRLGTREVIDFTVKNRYQLLSAWAPPDELRATYTMFEQALAEQGRAGLPFDFPCIRHVFVGETDEAARRDGEEAVEYYMKSTVLFRPIGAHEREEMIFGSPDTCVAKIERLHRTAGVNYILCWMNFGGMPQERVLRSLRLFAHQVLPRFR